MILKIVINMVTYFHLVSTERYCKLPCHGVQHPGCDCEMGWRCNSTAKKIPPNKSERQFIIKEHNTWRELFAADEEATNLVALTYNKELEYIAMCDVGKCGLWNRSIWDGCITYVEYTKSATHGAPCESQEVFKEYVVAQFQPWLDYNEIKRSDTNFSRFGDGFAVAAGPTVTSVGCGRVLNNNTCTIFCHYDPLVVAYPQYRQAGSCTLQKGYYHLCKPPTKRDKHRRLEIQKKVISSVNYCRLTCNKAQGPYELQNSACACDIGDKCSTDVIKLTPTCEEKDYIVQIHNDGRELMASEEGASNMEALTYDDELEYVAQCHALQCIVGVDVCRKTSVYEFVGQNYFLSESDISCRNERIFKTAFDDWFKESEMSTSSCIKKYSVSKCDTAKNFTQLIWATTKAVGCGRVKFNGTCLIVCNYGAAGNIDGESVFKRGPKKCQTADGYPHLCKGLTRAKLLRTHPVSSSPLLTVFSLHWVVIVVSIYYNVT